MSGFSISRVITISLVGGTGAAGAGEAVEAGVVVEGAVDGTSSSKQNINGFFSFCTFKLLLLF